MEKTKKSIFSKIFVCLSLCLVLLGALAPCFSMNNNQPLKADSVSNSYSFEGSNLYYFDTFRYEWGWQNAYPVLFSASFDNYESSTSVRIVPNFLWVQSVDNSMHYIEHSLWSFGSSGVYEEYPSIQVSLNSGASFWFSTSSSDMNSGTYFPVSCFVSSDFNCNIYKVSITLDDHLYYDELPSNMKALNLCYYDVNDNFICFGFYVPYNYVFDNRIYYLDNPNSFSDNTMYNNGYNNGYFDGYNTGNAEGSDNGYKGGYYDGHTIGYNKGYYDGMNEGSQYTFFNLIGATIDAPIQYFQSLFNFELLGINLSSFLMGLFTLCIVVTIVKLCLGR